MLIVNNFPVSLMIFAVAFSVTLAPTSISAYPYFMDCADKGVVEGIWAGGSG
jgi:hypothetical protein